LPLAGATPAQRPPQTGRLKQALFRSAFDPAAPLEDVCRTAADLGVHGFDAIESKDWPTLKRFGLKPTLAYPPNLTTICGGPNTGHQAIFTIDPGA